MTDANHCDVCWEAWIYGDPDPHPRGRLVDGLKVAAVVIVAAAFVALIVFAPSGWWAR